MATGRDERPLSRVPPAVWALLAVLLTLQAGWRLLGRSSTGDTEQLPAAPSAAFTRAGSLGDPLPVAKVLMLRLQSFDYRADNRLAYQQLDYGRLEEWLDLILALDPQGQYPLMSASRIYAEVVDETKQRQMLEYVYSRFLDDPGRRWPWLAHAAAIAKHRLHDLPLARRYAAAIQRHATGADVPTWARQMEVFILEDMNELETARIMIGGFLEKGLVKDPAEARFLEQRLKEIEARTAAHK